MTDLIRTTLDKLFTHHNLPVPTELSQSAKPVRLGFWLDQARKSQKSAEKSYFWGDFAFYPDDYILEKEGQSIKLTEKEAALLELLAKSKGKPVSRDALLKNVWRYSPEAETHTLETHIYRLRQKIEDDPANPSIVVTEGDGYRLQGM